MITTIDKAIVALIGAILFFLNNFLGINFGIGEEVLNGIAIALTPILVWLTPNKPASP